MRQASEWFVKARRTPPQRSRPVKNDRSASTHALLSDDLSSLPNMPKVLPAVGLAASALQLIDFVVKIFQKEHEVYQPRVGARIEHEHLLCIVTHELYGLTEKIEERKTQQSSAEKRSSKYEDSIQQLLRLSDKTKDFAFQLIDGFEQARERCLAGETSWAAPREALQVVWDKGNFNMHKKRFPVLRKEFDAALLRVLK